MVTKQRPKQTELSFLRQKDALGWRGESTACWLPDREHHLGQLTNVREDSQGVAWLSLTGFECSQENLTEKEVKPVRNNDRVF